MKFTALPLTLSKVPEKASSISEQIIPVQNTSPNSNTSHVGSSYYIQTETLPNQVSLRPDPSILSADTLSSSGLPIVIDFKIKEITPVITPTVDGAVTPGSNDTIPQYETKILASFENIPITEYSTVEVKIDMASTTQVEMKVTDQYEDVYSSTVTYAVTTSTAPNAVLVGSTSGVDAQVTSPSGGEPPYSPYPQYSVGTQSAASSIDIGYLIGSIRVEIQKSGVRANFKQRYLLKLNTIEKNYKSLIESKKRLARIYAKDTTASLAAIVKDLNRSRSLYYRGGMRKSEAAFLLLQFSRLSRAFGD
jgi:ACT domain-containing protein